MAILKFKEIKSMARPEIEAKLKDLRLELIKSNVTAQKTKSKTKEIKRTIARLLTIIKQQEASKKK